MSDATDPRNEMPVLNIHAKPGSPISVFRGQTADGEVLFSGLSKSGLYENVPWIPLSLEQSIQFPEDQFRLIRVQNLGGQTIDTVLDLVQLFDQNKDRLNNVLEVYLPGYNFVVLPSQEVTTTVEDPNLDSAPVVETTLELPVSTSMGQTSSVPVVIPPAPPELPALPGAKSLSVAEKKIEATLQFISQEIRIQKMHSYAAEQSNQPERKQMHDYIVDRLQAVGENLL